MEPLFPQIPENFADLSDEDLAAFIAETADAVEAVTSAPDEFVTDDRTSDDVFEAANAAVEALEAARAEQHARAEASAEEEAAAETEGETEAETEAEDEPEAETEAASETDRFADLAARATADSTPVEPVVASAAGHARRPLPRPARRNQALTAARTRRSVAVTAAAPNLGHDIGDALDSAMDIAEMMTRRRGQFGSSINVKGEKNPIARWDWRDQYGDERTLGMSESRNYELVAAAYDPDAMRAELKRRVPLGLTASGGICAPVTPYYNLQMISVADRPVRAALAAFNADRGGMRYARPASLADITDAVGVRTSAEDAAGGTEAEKSCQVVSCPDFIETDVEIIYHCLQFGNLGARTFPERVAQWNNLVLAAHARLAEGELLTAIDGFSTHVGASNLGLGASASFPSQLITAGAAIRSVNRMDDDAILRALIPVWVLDLLVSDMYRTQFQRFEMSKVEFVTLLRQNNIEPSFYKDSATGRDQVFTAQGDGLALESFPASAWTYLFPEGSFIFLDGGILELGLVRDSVLNRTNDFQIFGESFEGVAYVGVTSYALETEICDTGAVTAPASAPDCPISY